MVKYGSVDMNDIPLWRSEEGKFVNRFSTKNTWLQLRSSNMSLENMCMVPLVYSETLFYALDCNEKLNANMG